MQVSELEFDDRVIQKLAQRGIGVTQVWQILVNRPIFLKNKRRGTGAYKMVGIDDGGTMVTVIIRPLDRRAGRWLCITGWPSTAGERTQYRR